MSRELKMVEGLWREWTEGVPGRPSIRELDNLEGSRWRAGRQSEIQWYSLRLEAIKEI
jgi:Transcriptional activator of glycolytic enzymes